jgi:hypothetical protein
LGTYFTLISVIFITYTINVEFELKKEIKYGLIVLFLCIGSVFLSLKGYGQTRDVVQVTGLVVAGDSAYGVQGVYIYNATKGRGTVSNFYGYFSMPVLEGDTITLRAIGYKKKVFEIPDSVNLQLSILIQLQADTISLPTISITPWKTERLFKHAFLSMEIPQDNINMQNNLNEQVMRRMLYTSGATAGMNHSYYMQQYVQRQEQSRAFFMPNMTQQFINPFAWATFLKQVKAGGLKDNRPEIDPYEEDE